jgi:acetyl-CoA acetyltransferase
MAPSRAQPIVIGVGDVVNRSTRVEDAREPLDLMIQAITAALADTGLDSDKSAVLRSNIDSISVVLSWTWPYPDLVGSVAERLGVNPPHKVLSPHGGNKPGKLFDEAARRISKGETKVAVLTGGEALASRTSTASKGYVEVC